MDLGSHGSWLPDSAGPLPAGQVDGEPGAQMKWRAGRRRPVVPEYDFYYTNGANGTPAGDALTAGRPWRVFNPVVPDLFGRPRRRPPCSPRS